MSFKGMARVLIVFLPLVISSGLPRRSSPCPPSSFPEHSVLNCSSAGLWAMPQIQDTVAHLDVSHNRLERVTLMCRMLPRLRSLRLANNSVARLSLCIHRRVRGRGCDSWAPNLQLLSVERNLLRRLPRGLSALKALEVLQLSYNSISGIQPGELDNLRQLRELHLQHNLIGSLHPHALQHLQQLKVLDVSFNLLATLNPSMYFSLRTIGADVRLAGNRWRCDCSMRSIRRWIALDRSRGSQLWAFVCASPPVLAGGDLLQLEDDDLNCWNAEDGPQLHQDVTVSRGSEILLSCTTKGAFWWTPSGSEPANRPQSGLLISDITEKNAGLYVCLSKDHQVVSVFHLQIQGTKRKARSAPERIAGEERSQSVTQSDLTLAVCLSVFITFLVAFILGVLLRPCLDMLWKKIIKKKTPDSVPKAEERQYDNEAYSEGEDPEDLQPQYDNVTYSEGEVVEESRPYRERRVTFSNVDIVKENEVKYYDTEQEKETCNAAVERELVRDSGSEKSLEESVSEDRKHLSDRNFQRHLSDSSLSDKDQIEVNTVQQNSKDLPHISHHKIPGFSSEPFADWLPHPNNGGLLAPEPEDNEEQFDFSDSVRSTSPRTSSPVGSFNYTRQIMPRLNRKDSSSSSSYMSDEEPSEYTVNPEPQEDEVVGRSYAKTEISNRLACSNIAGGSEATQNQDTELWWPVVDLDCSMRIQRRMDIKSLDGDGQKKSLRDKPRKGKVITAGVIPLTSFSSTESEGEARCPVTVLRTLDSQTNCLELKTPPHRRLDIKAPSDSLSDRESEDGLTHLTEASQKVDREGLRGQEEHKDTDGRWPSKEQQTTYVESQLDLKSTLADSYSSSDSEEVTRASITQPRFKVAPSYDPQPPWPLLNLAQSFRIKRCLDVTPLSPTSDSMYSIDSEDETMYYMQKREQGTLKVARDPIKVSPKLSYDQHSPWPSIDLEDSFRIRRRLNVNASSLTSESSFRNDGEDDHKPEQVQVITNATSRPRRAPPPPSYDRQPHWPSIDLEGSFRIRRCLDVKAPSPTSDLSFRNNGENEITNHKTEHVQVITNATSRPRRAPPPPNYDRQARWPSVDLEESFRIRKRLDVKAPSPTSDLSFRNDGENEMTAHKPEHVQVIINETRRPRRAPPPPSYDRQAHWPSVDLEESFRIRRRLDVKAPSPTSDSSSSSGSEKKTMYHTKKQEQGTTTVTTPPIRAPPTPIYNQQSPWPSIDLEDSFKVKRHLDVKALASTPDSSSSNVEDERVYMSQKHEQGAKKVNMYPSKTDLTSNYDPQGPWPSIDVDDSLQIKRRLDVKPMSTTSHSSSKSDSEDEVTNHREHVQVITNETSRPRRAPPPPSYDRQAHWPSVDLEESFRIRRRLDVKAPSPTSDSSSSSGSENKTMYHTKKQEQGTTTVTTPPIRAPPTPIYNQQSPWPSIDLEDSFQVKRHLDVKALASTPDSSSSNVEDERVYMSQKHEQGAKKVNMYPIKTDLTSNYDPQGPWPSIDVDDSLQIKRRLDVKPMSTTSHSSSKSDSEDEVTNHREHVQVITNETSRPRRAPPPPSYDRQAHWPSVDLEESVRIKRHLDVKAPSPTSDLSFKNDGENEMTNHKTEQVQAITNATRRPMRAPPPPSYDRQARWPCIDLKESFRIRRRLDVKAPSPTSDSSSSSGSENKTKYHTKKQEQGTTTVTSSPFKAPPTPIYDQQAPWPSIDLEDSFKVKRHLDVKALASTPDSSSSNVEDEIVYMSQKHEQGGKKVNMYLSKTDLTSNYDPQGPWASIDVDDSLQIKRRLDVKPMSTTSHSSSRSDSEDELTNHREHVQVIANATGRPRRAPPPPSYDRQPYWPSTDLDDSFRIRRRLDVKAPSPTSDSSSSSGSENKTKYHTKKHEQGTTTVTASPFKAPPTPIYDQQAPWPSIDLEDSFKVKRHLDVKALGPTPDSSSSSNGEDERVYMIQKDEQGAKKVHMYPRKAHSTSNYDPQGPWPSIDVEDSLQIKRRLDVKPMSTTSHSSSRSDSEDELTNHREHVQVIANATGRPRRAPPPPSYDPPVRWPSTDLDDSFRIRRRLDVKVSSPTSDSSSSSDSEDKRMYNVGKQEQGTTTVTASSFKAPSPPIYDQQASWPSVELENSFRVKRRLDVKGPTLDTSSDSEDETKYHTQKHKQGITEPITPSYDPQAPWPSIDLDSFQMKRRLNVKIRSQPSDLLFSTNIEHETTHQPTKQEEGTTKTTKYPIKTSPPSNIDPQSPSPPSEFEDSFRIKRCLDFKGLPTSDLSCSSDNGDERTNHSTKQEHETRKVTRYQNEAPPLSYDPRFPWPSINFEDSFRTKRRLNVKAPSPPSDDISEHEVTLQQEKGSRIVSSYTKGPPTLSYDLQVPQSLLDLEDSLQIKRRLDFKTLSPTSHLLPSGNSEDETMNYIPKQEQGMTKLSSYPIKVSAPSYDPQSLWPSLDLEDSFRTKRRLNIKAPSLTSNSLSGSDSEPNTIIHVIKREQGTSNLAQHSIKVSPIPSYDQELPQPSLELENSFQIKRSLDFKAPQSTSELSSTSTKQERAAANIARNPIHIFQTPGHYLQGLWSSLDLNNPFRVKRRLDIIAPSPALSTSSDSEENTSVDLKRQGYYEKHNGISEVKPSNNHDLIIQGPTVDFQRIKRLDIKAPPLASSTSDSELNRDPELVHHGMYGDSEAKKTVHRNKSATMQASKQDQETRWPFLDLGRNPRLKRRLDVKVQSPHDRTCRGDSKVEAPGHGESTTGTPWPLVELGKGTHVRRWLDIKVVPADVSHEIREDRIVGVNLQTSSNEEFDVNADATEIQAFPGLHLGISRRLDIRTPSPQPDPDSVFPKARYSKSNISTSDSEHENRAGKDLPKVEEKSSVKSPVISIPPSPQKIPDITLEKYVLVPANAGDGTSRVGVEINPELQSRWANMHLGFSRFRKRLEITSHAREPPEVPLSERNTGGAKQNQPLVGWKGLRETESQLTEEQVHHNTNRSAVDVTSEVKSSLSSVPHIRRYLDIKAPPTQQRLDSSKTRENEAQPADHTMWRKKSHEPSDFSLYATQIVATGLTTDKSQVTTLSGNNSQDEQDSVVDFGEMTEVAEASLTADCESPIQYRRLIIKASSPSNDNSTSDQHATKHSSSESTSYKNPSLTPKTIPILRSGDDTSPTRDQRDYYPSTRYPLPYSVRHQIPSIVPKSILNSDSEDDTPSMKDPSGVNILTTQYGSSYSTRYQLPYRARHQNPYLGSKSIPNPGSDDDTPATGDPSEVNIVTTQSSSSDTGRYQNSFAAPKTVMSPDSGYDIPQTRNPLAVGMIKQSGSSSSTRYQIASITPRPFRRTSDGPPTKMQWAGLRTHPSDLSKPTDPSPLSPLKRVEETTSVSFTPEVALERGSTLVTRSLNPSDSSLSSLATNETWKDGSENSDRRGLSALKVMSSERKTWDRDNENVDSFPPSHIPENFNPDRSEFLISTPSASAAEELLYNFPRYRTHAPLRDQIPPQLSPLPDEEVELMWNSKSSDSPGISQV